MRECRPRRQYPCEHLGIESDAERGGTSTLTFTPIEAGTYDVMCAEPGYRESGMTARVVVE